MAHSSVQPTVPKHLSKPGRRAEVLEKSGRDLPRGWRDCLLCIVLASIAEPSLTDPATSSYSSDQLKTSGSVSPATRLRNQVSLRRDQGPLDIVSCGAEPTMEREFFSDTRTAKTDCKCPKTRRSASSNKSSALSVKNIAVPM